MRIKILLVVLLAASVSLATHARAQACNSKQFDMLDWMAPQAGTSNGHFNVVYPTEGKFYWVKGAAGFPWDVDNFDKRYIYQSITEQVWNDPTTYKIFQQALPWMPRCIVVRTIAGKLASIQVQPSHTNYDIHSSCTSFITQNLGYVVNEIWGPYTQTIGSLPPTPTLILSFRYSCDINYSNCLDQETFAMQKNNGLVQWTHYHLQNGVYAQVNQTTQGFDTYATVTPVHPCW